MENSILSILSPDNILLIRGRVWSLCLLPLSTSLEGILSVDLRLGLEEMFEPLIERFSVNSSVNSVSFELTVSSDGEGTSPGFSLFFSLEKMDTLPYSITIDFYSITDILLSSQAKLKLFQSFRGLKDIENISFMKMQVWAESFEYYGYMYCISRPGK
ncbi:MAG: hypothetical protein F3745_03900 [Nitrospinae bacterium]|nr:hypothetical protein [Nitrospinota bacterium]